MNIKMQVMNFSEANCKNCYKCVRTCTVKAIDVLNDQARINETRCIACGHCLMVCPQNARHVLSDIDKLKISLAQKRNIVAALAPSFRGVFENPGSFITALRNLGISRIEEVSIGAELVSSEYERLIAEGSDTEYITSCCPSVVMLIEKYYPELIPKLLPVSSPMIAHGKSIKDRDKNDFVVFIGPCISKKCEVLVNDNYKAVDAVLTFDEIIEFMKDSIKDYESLPPDEPDYSGSNRGDKYPVVGGILNGIKPTLNNNHLDVLKIHGLDNCKTVLQDLKDKKISNVCIEMSACNESCLGGPGILSRNESPFIRLKRIQNYLTREQGKILNFTQTLNLSREFKDRRVNILKPSEEKLREILRSMGKYSKEQELNCGACGYDSCVEKATSVYNGMSQVEMCVPYMRSLAENMNSEIFKNSPNALIYLEKGFIIRDINPAGVRIFLQNSDYDIIGCPISDIIDDEDFNGTLDCKGDILSQKVYYEKFDFYGYKSIIHINNHSSYLVIFTDITENEKRKQDVLDMKRKAIDVTQTIVNKQMRVAQEIASLLGETTAETKVAILDLNKVLEKDSME